MNNLKNAPVVGMCAQKLFTPKRFGKRKKNGVVKCVRVRGCKDLCDGVEEVRLEIELVLICFNSYRLLEYLPVVVVRRVSD